MTNLGMAYASLSTCIMVPMPTVNVSLMFACSGSGAPTLNGYLGLACSGTVLSTTTFNTTCNLPTGSTLGGSQIASCVSSMPSLTTGMASANVYFDAACMIQLETIYVTAPGVGKCQAQNGTASQMTTSCSSSAATFTPYSGTSCTGTAGGPLINTVGVCMMNGGSSIKVTAIMCPSSALGLAAAAAKIGLLVLALVALVLIL